MDYLRNVIISFIAGSILAYFLTNPPEFTIEIIDISRNFIISSISNTFIILVIISGLFLLSLPSIMKYGHDFEKYIKRNPKIFVHELDIFYLTTIFSFVITLHLNNWGNISFLSNQFIPFVSLDTILYITVFYIFYKGLPAWRNITWRFFSESTAIIISGCALYAYGNLENIFKSNSIIISFYIMVFVALFHTIPWAMISYIIQLIKKISIANIKSQIKIGYSFSKDKFNSEDKYKDAICMISKPILLCFLSLILLPFRNWLSNDKRDNEYEDTILSLFEDKIGQTREDKAYRYLRKLVRESYDCPTPHIINDNEKYPNDLLKRQDYIDSMFEQITAYLKSAHTVAPMTIGMFSEWGDGKSFIVRKLISKIEGEEPNIICITTHPWKSFIAGSEKSITENFFMDIELGISEHIRSISLRKLFRDYTKQMSGKFGINSHGFSFGLNLISQKSLEDIQKSINSELRKSEKKLLIVLEDIDRLDKDELIKCFRLIRASEGFSNTVFLLPCDKKQIDKLILENKLDTSYSQKFIQYESYVPAIEATNISKYISNELEEYWRDEVTRSIDEIKSAIDNVINRDEFYYVISNLRHAKRLVNGIKLPYVALEKEVSLEDFIEIEIIKQIFPTLYRDIRNNPKYYVANLGASENISEDIKEEHIKIIIDELPHDKITKDTAFKIIKGLFSGIRYTQKSTTEVANDALHYGDRKYRVNNPRYFWNYINQSIYKIRLSNEETDKIISETLKDDYLNTLKKHLLNLISNNKIKDFLYEIHSDDFNIKDANIFHERFIEVLSNNEKEFSNLRIDDFKIFLNSILSSLEKIPKEKTQQTLNKIIDDLTLYRAFIISDHASATNGVNLPITNEIKTKLVKRFIKTYIEGTEIFNTVKMEEARLTVSRLLEWSIEEQKINKFLIQGITSNLEMSNLFKEFFEKDRFHSNKGYIDSNTRHDLQIIINSSMYKELEDKFKSDKSLRNDFEDIIKISDRLKRIFTEKIPN